MLDPHSQRGPSPEEAFALAVRDRREALGWSQEELARRVSADTGAPFHQTGITRIEKSARGVRLNEAVALARVLGIDLGTFDLDDSERDEMTERGLVVAIEQARKAREEHDNAVYRLQMEMDAITDRYQRAREQFYAAEALVERLEAALERVRAGMRGVDDGDR
jgi:transcriptional regulator with XRE-family HTH domain